jgi:hypothetical protein
LEGTQPILCEEDRTKKILSRGTLSLESINEVFLRILNDMVGKLIKIALFRRISTIISVISTFKFYYFIILFEKIKQVNSFLTFQIICPNLFIKYK